MSFVKSKLLIATARKICLPFKKNSRRWKFSTLLVAPEIFWPKVICPCAGLPSCKWFKRLKKLFIATWIFCRWSHMPIYQFYRSKYCPTVDFSFQARCRRQFHSPNWIRRYVGSNEFINGITRYCLWLKDCPLNEIRKMPRIILNRRVVPSVTWW